MQLDLKAAVEPAAAALAAAPLLDHGSAAGRFLQAGAGRAVDVGCGEGRFTRVLAKYFARMAGIDIRADRIATARAAAAAGEVKADFDVASAEAMPFADRSFDVAIFTNSLHHIKNCDVALREAARVIADDGLVYVMEPIAVGTYFQATRMIEDETEIRRCAYQALQRARDLRPEAEMIYRSRTIYESFDKWKAHQIHLDARRRKPFDENEAEMRRTFEGVAEPENGKLAFNQYYRINTFRKRLAG
jgi:ubiquinone/menaquinone biosynthesis C-methylase UbiE